VFSSKTKSKQLIEDETNDIFVSAVSFYEMSSKISIGKLILPDSLEFTIEKKIEKKILK